ncbi:MAG: hypothetical protein U0414_08400 [Polyangiaceae bacterium]
MMRARRFFLLGAIGLLGAACDDVSTSGTPSSSGAGGATTSSTSAGSTTSASTGVTASSSTGGPPGQVPAIVAVGYGALRVVSRDGGLTWGETAENNAPGGDDEDLLRAVAWGKGRWVATGWKLMTSDDGVTWTDHGKLADGILPCNIVEGLAFFQGKFWGACGYYTANDLVTAVFTSDDGVAWSAAPVGTWTWEGGHVFLGTTGDELFSWGDDAKTYRSTNGVDWAEDPSITAGLFCEGKLESSVDCAPNSVENGYYGGAFWLDGTWLEPKWMGKITRSTNGADFVDVYSDPVGNTPYKGTAFAAGFAAP